MEDEVMTTTAVRPDSAATSKQDEAAAAAAFEALAEHLGSERRWPPTSSELRKGWLAAGRAALAVAPPAPAYLADFVPCQACGWSLPRAPGENEEPPIVRGALDAQATAERELYRHRKSKATQGGSPPTIDHALALASAALTFGQVQRATLHPDGTPESDATHTVMLAMLVADLARAEGLDVGLAVQFAVVHDLPETYAGDTCTARALSADAAAAKAEREAASLARLTAELGSCWTTSMVERYEAQREPESRLVRYADKVLPKLTHALNGGRALRDIDMTAAEVEANHAAQGAKLRAAYPTMAATRALFDGACERALATMRSPATSPPHRDPTGRRDDDAMLTCVRGEAEADATSETCRAPCAAACFGYPCPCDDEGDI